MIHNYPYQYDDSFLEQVQLTNLRTQTVKITVLDFFEQPVAEVQGRTLNGTLNLDGKSAIRRNGNISLVVTESENDFTDLDNLFAINKKIEIEIGYKNNTDLYPEYPIIWLPQGIFVIASPSISHTVNECNITLQLKDKMSLLNGECGGALPATIIFDQYDTIDKDGNYVTTKPTIFQIIQELVHHWGGEDLNKIIINDVPLKIKQVVKWDGSDPIYINQKADSQYEIKPVSSEGENETKYNPGQDIGFIWADFVYPEDLIGEAGASITSVLDKIKNTLGNYEYFYDINGNFIFQEIKNYLNTSYSTNAYKELKNSDYIFDIKGRKTIHAFEDSKWIISYSNSPQYENIKNDFIIWGNKKSTDNNDGKAISYHLAIDKKPKNQSYSNIVVYDKGQLNEKYESIKDFCVVYPEKTYDAVEDLPATSNNHIGYKLKNSNGTFDIYVYSEEDKKYKRVTAIISKHSISSKDWRTDLLYQGAIDAMNGTSFIYSYYYEELVDYWNLIYDLRANNWISDINLIDIEHFLDFIDTDSDLNQISVQNIGRRTKVLVDDKINCIFEPDIPNFLYIKSGEPTPKDIDERDDQIYIQVEDFYYNNFAIGGSYNSAFNAARELLYQYTQYDSTITLNTIPLCQLEPNSILTIQDPKSGIYGDYLINTISLSLDINGTMSISCTKVLERI